jgi:hypothetical protein
MLKNVTQLKDTIEGKEFCFYCENDASIGGAKEFLFRCLTYMGKIEEAIKAQQEQAAQEKPAEVKEESKVENIG